PDPVEEALLDHGVVLDRPLELDGVHEGFPALVDLVAGREGEAAGRVVRGPGTEGEGDPYVIPGLTRGGEPAPVEGSVMADEVERPELLGAREIDVQADPPLVPEDQLGLRLAADRRRDRVALLPAQAGRERPAEELDLD